MHRDDRGRLLYPMTMQDILSAPQQDAVHYAGGQTP